MNSKTNVKWLLEYKTIQSAWLCNDRLLKCVAMWGRDKDGW